MLTSLTMSLCLWVTAAEPVPVPDDGASPVGPTESFVPIPNGSTTALVPHGYQSYGFEGNSGGLAPAVSYGGYGFDNCPTYNNRRCGHAAWCCDFWCPPCTMSQRLEYWPAEHGYYYFRPYNMGHVRDQREIARSWGEDPRNPYDHKVFERVYQTLKTDRAAHGDGPQVEDAVAPIDSTSRSRKAAVNPASFALPRAARLHVGHQSITVPEMLPKEEPVDE